MTFNADKAQVFNQLRLQGLPLDAAFQQAGIAPADRSSYQIDREGSADPESEAFNPNFGQLIATGSNNPQAVSQITEITIGQPIQPPATTGQVIVTEIPPAPAAQPRVATDAPAAQPGALVGLDPVSAEIALQQAPQQVFNESEIVPGFGGTAFAPAPLQPQILGLTESEVTPGFITQPVPLTESEVIPEFTADPRAAGENVGIVRPAPVAVGLTESEVIPEFTSDPRAAGENTPAVIEAARKQMPTSNGQALPITSADWRVRLSLAKSAFYLYQAPDPGILAPLARTNGVIFPYTPTIETSYTAKYDTVDLTHSNYRGYFYKNSAIENLNIRCIFTAQDTREAEYLLAVIHFFRSVTKMFYGAKDKLAGTPPPLVFLSGLGQYQFNNQPCVVSNFQYVLPSDVDYIRALGFNNYGINLENRRNQGSGPPAGGILGAIGQIKRLSNNGLISSLLGRQRPGSDFQSNFSRSNYTNSTYVPTRIDIVVTLLPVQTRSQVSTQFNMEEFANGDLLKGGGFW